MNNFPAVFRSLIVYAVCVVLAVWLGIMLANPLSYSQLLLYGILAFTLVFPILLRWHYQLLLLSWNLAAVAFFLPGRPSMYLLMVALSLGISVLQRMLSKESKFIIVPQITLPLFFMMAVIAVTAKINGAGLHMFGSEVYGGKKYFFLLGGILGYFALTARRIPLERKNLYIGLYFLGGLSFFISDLIPILPHSFYYIYWVFRPNLNFFQNQGGQGTRLTGAGGVATVVLWYMLARYGFRGVFFSRKPLRWVTFVLFFVYGLFGGFRSFILGFALLMAMLFYLEGLHRTKWLPIALLSGSLGAIALIPLAPHLPYTFQRAISFMPYNVSEAARFNAQASWDWRVNMWESLLPEIPRYLLLGKGYTINPLDYEFVMGPDASIHSPFARNDPLALAEDFHNGPLSVVIPFGIWGCIAFLWFLAAGLRVTYLNFRNGDPALKTVNTFLFAAFFTRAIFFLFAFGDLSSGMTDFTGLLGLSVALNAGVRRRVLATPPVRENGKFQRPGGVPGSPVPAFQRRLPGTSRS